jgi:multidrug efflux pump
MRLELAFDSAIFIEESIAEVRNTFLIALGLVILTVLVFLKSVRATLIPVVAIPVAIVGTFTAVYALDFSINIITMLALVLAIGLVVDDAIVVLENIFRHREMGRTRRQAAFAGMREIGFAVIATTISLVSVFLPVAFLTGTVGRLFREFGISLALAVIISSFVALTLTPVLCSLLLGEVRKRTATNWRERSFEAFFDGLNSAYAATLRWVMARPVVLLLLVAVVVGITGWFYQGLPRELVPTEDRGAAFGIVIAPEGATLDYTDRYMQQVEQVLLPIPERESLFTATGLGFGGPGRVTNGFLFLRLAPRDERDRSQQEIVQSVFPRLMGIPGVLAFVINPPSLGGRGNTSPVEYVLQGDDYQTLGQAVQAFMARASELGYLVNLDTDLRLNKPQLEIRIDRERAAQLGVSVTDIGTTLETFLGGRVASEFTRGNKKYDVITQVRPSDRARPDVIRNLYLRGNAGLVQLANVVTVTETVAPKELNHYNRVRSATITANLAPGADLGQALDDLDAIAADVLPDGVRTDLAGQSLEFRESTGSLTFMFGLAVVFIFLVLAAQFESFVHPLTILLSVPLAVVGAIVSLFFLGQSLNIFSQIGLVMLVGLVAKNAILIVEFANQLRARGKQVGEAVVEAAVIRLRPILMTSLSTVFGILPIAIGFGAGAESRRPLGIAVVGGVLFSTFLTLLVVPVVYRLLARYTGARREAEIEDDLRAAQEPPPQPEATSATAAVTASGDER